MSGHCLWHWFCKTHVKLTLRMAQELDIGHAKDLYITNVVTFYNNLKQLLNNGYEPLYT